MYGQTRNDQINDNYKPFCNKIDPNHRIRNTPIIKRSQKDIIFLTVKLEIFLATKIAGKSIRKHFFKNLFMGRGKYYIIEKLKIEIRKLLKESTLLYYKIGDIEKKHLLYYVWIDEKKFRVGLGEITKIDKKKSCVYFKEIIGGKDMDDYQKITTKDLFKHCAFTIY